MDADLKKKKGGPYNKDDQENRRKEIARLHFEYGYSARKIAEVMQVNRNTVNSDIKYWYDIIKEETQEIRGDLFLQQIGRLEAQRTRILEEIMDGSNEKIKLEKLLLEVDTRINDILMKTSTETRSEEPSREPLIREIVLFLIIKYAKNQGLTEDKIVSEIINMQHCTSREAEDIFSEMEVMGLEYCKKYVVGESLYDLIEFALMRRYIKPNDEFLKGIQALWILHHHLTEQINNLGLRYQNDFGKKETWDDEIFSRFDDEKEKIKEKSANTFANIMSDIIENIGEMLNQEKFMQHMQYMKVFFGQDKSMLEEILKD